jgi:coenzyme F420-reducing hydrogenase alpha subunit
MIVGGFPKLPARDAIGRLISGLEGIRGDAHDTLKMIAELNIPNLEAETEHVALSGDINKGIIVSDLGLRTDEDAYSSSFEESEVSYANAKITVVKGRGSLMVGALSRLNLNLDKLHPEARQAAREIGFAPPLRNPFMNNVAQAVEIINGIEECIELLDGITGRDNFIMPKLREGAGSAVTEAPRGLLHHYYQLNRKGVIERANIVTPTAHNFLSLEEALRKLAGENIHLAENELVLKCEMLVRAYDPCFSCSVH